MTENKRQILEALRGWYHNGEYFEYGPPPYCAADVVMLIGGNVRNTSRTLQLMEDQGLVKSETIMRDQACEVPKFGHYPRPVTGYWRVETMAEDQARAKIWRDASKERSERAFEKMMSLFGPYACMNQPQGGT
ncbi:hypothetical protein [Marinobacter sp.]|uniref:hypothetical protein n=1 Tax=Marinobacter sp. TaxID=50741 RepID=UPI003F94C5C5